MSFARRGLHRRPAEGAPCFRHSRSPPIRAKTFSYSKKRPANETVRRSFIMVHHRGLSRGLTNTALWCWLPPAGGRPVLVHGASQKRAPDPEIGGFFWCTISGSVQKTVQCTVFSDRSPRGECKPHRGAARARPVGDGAPPTSLSATHNAKKDPQVYRLQVLSLGAPSGTRTQGPLIKSQLLYQLS